MPDNRNPNVVQNPMTQKPATAFDKFKAAIGFLWSNNSMFIEMSPQAETFIKEAPLSPTEIYSQVEKQLYQTASQNGYFTSQLAYRNFIYGNNFTNKPWRLASYRVISNSPEVSLALDEISDAMMNENEKGEFIELTINNQNIDSFQQQVLEDEWTNIYSMFDMDTKGSEYCRRYLHEGELLFENIIDTNNTSKGIIGLKFVEPESYEYVVDVSSNVIGFMFNAMIQLNKSLSPQFQNYFNANPYFAGQVNGQIDYSSYASSQDGKILAMPASQFTWIREETNMNNNKTMIMPHVARVQQIWRRLLLLKDSLVIYRLVRAPMSRVFNVNVGDIHGNKKQAELMRVANMYKNSRVFNPQTGDISADYDVHALTHNFFFAKDKEGHGTSVENLEGGSPEFLKDLDDIKLVIRELYRGLKVPFDRWENSTNESNWYGGEKLSYEEASFYKFIQRLQMSFAGSMKGTFITHLKLTGLWEKYGLIESDFSVRMVPPPMFYAFVQKQAWLGKIELYKSTISKDIGVFSREFAAKQYLGMSEEDYQANLEQIEKEAIFDDLLKEKVKRAVDKAKAELDKVEGSAEELADTAEKTKTPDEEKKESTPDPQEQLPAEKASIDAHNEQEQIEKPANAPQISSFKEFYKEQEPIQQPQPQQQKTLAEPKQEELPFEQGPEDSLNRADELSKRAQDLDAMLKKLQTPKQQQIST